jgi:hypothetical protein
MKTFLQKTVLIITLMLGYFYNQQAKAQCSDGFTNAQINFDMHYFAAASLPTSPLQFAIGKNDLRFAWSGGANNVLTGINGTHTGEGRSLATGSDMEFSVSAGADTIVFDKEVSNLRFSVYDIDNRQAMNVRAYNAAGTALNVGLVRPTSGTIIVTGHNSTSATATADAYLRGVTETQGTVNVTIAGPVKKVVLTFTKSTAGNDQIWISDITACNNNTTTGTWAIGYQAIATPEVGQPAYMIASYGDSIVAVDMTNNIVELLYEVGNTNLIDTLFAPAINSLAYDPYNQIVYFCDNARTPSNRAVYKYDIKTGVKSTWIADVRNYGIQLFDNGMGSGGASFYDGALYLGQDMLNVNEPAAVYRLEIDTTTGNPIFAYRVWSKIGNTGSSVYDWADFVINNGVFYNFNSSAGRAANTGLEHIDLNTQVAAVGYSLTADIINGSQSGIDYTGTIYHFYDSAYQAYNNAGVLGARIVYTGAGTTELTDAAEAFKYPYDYGDAPTSYGLTYHLFRVSPNLTIGTLIDYEMVSASNPPAKADDVKNTGAINDEEGVASFPAISTSWFSYNVTVSVRNTTGANATIYGYMDFNRDGDFTDANERSLATTVANGATSVTVTWVGLTGGSAGSSFIRFRLASSAAEAGSPFGFARNGEVEDYPFPIYQVNLPVELVEFKGELKEDKTSLLTWKTASELNNDYFDLQRKKQDGTVWETIGKVDGYGNSNQLISYSFIDSKPEIGENYYRLQQVDFDGKFEFSNTIMLKLDAAATPEVKDDFVVYPNPAKNEFWIKSVQNRNTDTELTLDLFNITGEKIYSSVMKDNVQQVDVSNYQAGMYFIKIGTKKYIIIKE